MRNALPHAVFGYGTSPKSPDFPNNFSPRLPIHWDKSLQFPLLASEIGPGCNHILIPPKWQKKNHVQGQSRGLQKWGNFNLRFCTNNFWIRKVPWSMQWKYLRNGWSKQTPAHNWAAVRLFLQWFLCFFSSHAIPEGFLQINHEKNIQPQKNKPRCNCCMAWYLALVSWRLAFGPRDLG